MSKKQLHITINRGEKPVIEVRDHPRQDARYHGKPVNESDRVPPQPETRVPDRVYEIDADRANDRAE